MQARNPSLPAEPGSFTEAACAFNEGELALRCQLRHRDSSGAPSQSEVSIQYFDPIIDADPPSQSEPPSAVPRGLLADQSFASRPKNSRLSVRSQQARSYSIMQYQCSENSSE